MQCYVFKLEEEPISYLRKHSESNTQAAEYFAMHKSAKEYTSLRETHNPSSGLSILTGRDLGKFGKFGKFGGKQDPYTVHRKFAWDSRAFGANHDSKAHAAVRKLLLDGPPSPEPVTGVFVVSWDKDSETLKIKSNGTIPGGSTIQLKFVKDDFPLT